MCGWRAVGWSQEHRYNADMESWSFFISISNVRKHSDWLLAPVLASYASTILIFSLMVRQLPAPPAFTRRQGRACQQDRVRLSRTFPLTRATGGGRGAAHSRGTTGT